MIKIAKSSTHKLGVSVKLNFTINQHSRDAELIKGLIQYLGCGSYYTNSSLPQVEYRVSKSSDIDKIILFFDQYNLISVKLMDYKDFKRTAELMKNKAHLTQKGLDDILIIKGGMNKGRFK